MCMSRAICPNQWNNEANSIPRGMPSAGPQAAHGQRGHGRQQRRPVRSLVVHLHPVQERVGVGPCAQFLDEQSVTRSVRMNQHRVLPQRPATQRGQKRRDAHAARQPEARLPRRVVQLLPEGPLHAGRGALLHLLQPRGA